jgi:hypothetical protein
MSQFHLPVLSFGIACDGTADSVNRWDTKANFWTSIVPMKHDTYRRALSIICTASDAHRSKINWPAPRLAAGGTLVGPG